MNLKLPTQGQLFMPLLQCLEEQGPLNAREAAAAVADKMGLSDEALAVEGTYGDGRTYNIFRRKVRQTQQRAVFAGLMPREKFERWRLTDRGHKTLQMAQPGVVFCIAKTDLGNVLWAEALSALRYVDDRSTQMVIGSPPFPLKTQREYGGWQADGYVEHLMEHCDALKNKLTEDGSLIFNLSDVFNGGPTLSTYQEEWVVSMRKAGWFLCGKMTWENPSKPKTTPYVTKDRVRLANCVETYYWFAPTPNPKADNRRVLEPYSEKFKRILARGGELRGVSKGGSGITDPGLKHTKDNGGRIPFNLITVAHEGSRSAYVVNCIKDGLPVHPARMPAAPVNFWIRFATEPGDVVGAPFAGSLVEPAECEKLGRPYWAVEKCLDYLKGGAFRLREAAGFSANFDLFLDPCGS